MQNDEGYGDMTKKISIGNYWWWTIQERFAHR